MMTDPLSDMLARIRNGCTARHPEIACPSSRMKHAVARVLVEEGFLQAVELDEDAARPVLRIELRYRGDAPIIDGIRRVSRPGRRVYVGAKDVPRVRNGLGSAILSTPKGILSDRAARAESVGGEVLCEVW